MPGGKHVLKLTKPDVYGDYYFLNEGRGGIVPIDIRMWGVLWPAEEVDR
jgi:hypothetical protein